MSTNDTWILVSVPRRDAPALGRLATRAGLALIGWGDRRRNRPTRAVDLHRVERAVPAPRPFC